MGQTDGQTDGRQTVILRLPLDAAIVINFVECSKLAEPEACRFLSRYELSTEFDTKVLHVCLEVAAKSLAALCCRRPPVLRMCLRLQLHNVVYIVVDFLQLIFGLRRTATM